MVPQEGAALVRRRVGTVLDVADLARKQKVRGSSSLADSHVKTPPDQEGPIAKRSLTRPLSILRAKKSVKQDVLVASEAS